MNKYRPQSKNANKHTSRGLGLLRDSIGKDGWIGAMTVAADGESFDGSARLEVLADAMPDREPIVVESDGQRPVIVVRKDIASADDPRAKRLAIGANRIAQVDLEWDADVLKELSGEIDLSRFFYDTELAELVQPENFVGTAELVEHEKVIRPRQMLRILVSVPIDQALEARELAEAMARIEGAEVLYGTD